MSVYEEVSHPHVLGLRMKTCLNPTPFFPSSFPSLSPSLALSRSLALQVPLWWYAAVFLVSFVFGIIAIEVYDTQMPVYAFIVSLIIGAGFTLPIGII